MFKNTLNFDEEKHVYSIPGDDTVLVSVTQKIGEFFEPFDTDGVSTRIAERDSKPKQEVLEGWIESARLGTELHKSIETEVDDGSPEYAFYIQWKKDTGMTREAQELIVHDANLKIAGSIDAVYSDKDGYVLIDWKRTKAVSTFSMGKAKKPLSHLPDSTYTKYSLQLNVYAFLIERMYDIKIARKALVVLHPSNKSYIEVPVYDMRTEVELLFGLRKTRFLDL